MHSVIIGEINYIVQSIKLTKRPLLPSLADFVYFKYLITQIAYFTSSNIFMCNNSEQISLIALASAFGSW